MNILRTLGNTCLIALGVFCLQLSPYAAQAQTQAPELFTQDLKPGSNGIDVERLQKYLNTHGFNVAESGEGSLGQETQFFGAKTRAAVMRLQQQFSQQILAPLGLIYPTGNFFSATRTFVNNSLIAEQQIVPVQEVIEDEATTTAKVRKSRGGRGSSNSYAVLSSAGSNVTVSSLSPRITSFGATESYTVTAPTGYTISVGGTCPAGTWNGSIYTTGAINASINSYTVILSGIGISPSGARTVNHGSTASFTAESGLGYGLGTVSGTCPTGTWVHSTYTTGTITGSCTVGFESAVIAAGVGATLVGVDTLYLRQNGSELEFSGDGNSWTQTLFPTIQNGGSGTLVVHLVGDFTISSANSYIIIGSDDIEIRGENGNSTQPTIITVHTVSNYPGFIQNGTAVADGYNNVTVSNIAVNEVSSTLATNAGWLGQRYFGKGSNGNEFEYCSSSGDISTGGGGIVGANSEMVSVSRCYSTGAIGINGGGIVGLGSNSAAVSDSYSTGAISSGGGGIVGSNASLSTVSNSYTTGDMGGSSSGGIFGTSFTGVSASNVYTAGAGLSDQGFTGSGGFSASISGGYSEAANGVSGWTSSHADIVLTGIGTIWRSIAVNTPYVLSGFDASPYADSTQTIQAGETSTGVIGYYSNCSIATISGGSSDSYSNITIDQDTGIVSTTSSVEPGTYDISVHCTGVHGTYTIGTLSLEVR